MCRGSHGETVRNNNGRRLIDFCQLNDMIVANTYYEHKSIHKFTRQGPMETEKSIIDFILVKRSNQRVIKDIRVRKGPEISSSDHYLLEAKIKSRNSVVQTSVREEFSRIQYELTRTYKLRDSQIAKVYEENLNMRIEIFMESANREDLNLELIWLTFKQILREAERRHME